MTEVSIIILTYNSSRHITQLLESLIDKYFEQIKNTRLEIIVADNSSQDDTTEKVLSIKNKVPNIKFVQNGGNVGFSKGNNLAAKKAKGDFLIFINPDSKFIKGDIFSLLSEFEDERVGIVGGRILDRNGKEELSCGKFYTALNTLLLSIGLEEKLGIRFAPRGERKVDFVSGGFLAIRRELFEKLRGFDEHYFMYIEDSDLCFRAKKLGFETVFSPGATIEHEGQGSSNRSFAVINIFKGLVYFNKKHGGFLAHLFVKVMLTLKALLLVIIGKIINNKYLVDTYSRALRV